ncbi:chlorophyll synthesis pathway protein BchC [Roseomonas sp. BU-1]|uniref:Chlorophyll synthesis pathway protein BchC n=1 Tax=Falsiroseomonas selenitidurans TaxID=2716335 RepID=A0ABX1EAX3_9PROT|nr:chlorophyll synthesis pathway protein BchC [Falsiroseomonas selenitidurans]NKC33973.1 chlorophyll synthesis pathway protein BchC [Falsiroseomonas selenitidurans]
MDTVAVLLEAPERLVLSRLELSPPGEADVVVDVEWSGISTGTERLLWSGRMPHFPGMGYPLVPGYESVGRVAAAGPAAKRRVGERVFVPGARCFGAVRGLFGGAAARLVVPDARAVPIDEALGADGVLMALAATAQHAIAAPHAALPDLIIGHGVLGRLVARLVVAAGGTPVVWESNPARRDGASGYAVLCAETDPRRDYRCICDVSGDSLLLDSLVQRLAPGGEIVLAGFYGAPLSFSFPPAFMREARFRVAAEWKEADLVSVRRLLDAGRLSLEGLITHRSAATAAPAAYRTAFTDPACLKMILDWRACS